MKPLKKEINIRELRIAYEQFLTTASDKTVCEITFSRFGKLMHDITMGKIRRR